MKQKPTLSFWQIWNMSFGFLGIQFGFALQGGFMSRIFQSLGAAKDDIPLLWIAAPLTGLLVQPIIGYMSDKTWHPKLGRRRPYFLVGAILSSIALIFVPHSPVLWVAAGCLWILDASINISMEPFRALVADKLNEKQRSYGFMVQTLIIGIGTWVASQLPWFINKVLKVSNEAPESQVPDNVKYAFLVGGIVFLVSILYTIFTTSEYSPEEMEAFHSKKEETAKEEKSFSLSSVPRVMWKLGVVQFFSWFAFFTMWSMATPALTEHVYNAAAPVKEAFNMAEPVSAELFQAASDKFNNAADLVGSAMGTYGLSSMLFAFILVLITRKSSVNRKFIHMFSLVAGASGFFLMYTSDSTIMLNASFALIGISWGSILSMPYAMLSSSLDPKKMGLFMGLFNMFIVIPQIVAALGGVNLLSKIFGDGAISPMLLAGTCLLLGAVSCLLITDKNAISYNQEA